MNKAQDDKNTNPPKKKDSATEQKPTKESADAKPDSTEGNSDVELLKEIGLKLRNAIEEKDWQSLEELCPVSAVWLLDRSVTVPDWIDRLKQLLAGAEDIEWSILELKAIESNEDHQYLSFTTQLIWSDGDTWEEHEITSDAHMGLAKKAGEWKLDSLGFVRPETVPEVVVAAVDIPAAAYYHEVAAVNTPEVASYHAGLHAGPFTATPYTTYFSTAAAATPYFAAAMPGMQIEEPPPAPPIPSGYVAVYVPILVPAHLAMSLAGK